MGADNGKKHETDSLSGVQSPSGVGRDGCEKTLAELAQRFDVHPNRITEWKRQLSERAVDLFGGGTAPADTPVDLKALHAKIGQLRLEDDFLEGALTKVGWRNAKR